jgi:hypothetical protein
MSDIVALFIKFLESYLLEILIVVVGWVLLSELYTGRVSARYGRTFTRSDNPFRYWFWILFQALALALLMGSWTIGYDFSF